MTFLWHRWTPLPNQRIRATTKNNKTSLQRATSSSPPFHCRVTLPSSPTPIELLLVGTFPSLPHPPPPANAREKEPELLRRWHEEGLYQQCQLKNLGSQEFILHDGPPCTSHSFSLLCSCVPTTYTSFQMPMDPSIWAML